MCVQTYTLYTSLATPQWGFSGPIYKQTVINSYSNKHNKVKNPNWQKADQLAREVELGATENNISSGQNGI